VTEAVNAVRRVRGEVAEECREVLSGERLSGYERFVGLGTVWSEMLRPGSKEGCEARSRFKLEQIPQRKPKNVGEDIIAKM
jgi:hypothetical protein